MAVIDVKSISKQIKKDISLEVKNIITSGGRAPHLAAIIVGNNPASEAYVANKIKTCKQVGIESTTFRLEENISQNELLDCIHNINQDDNIDGFILQLPIPKHLNASELLLAIDPDKDVDGFHPMNIGKMVLGMPTFLPATPYGIVLLIEELGLKMAGKKVAILGRSDIVGTPMSLLLSRKSNYGNATVTLLHSQSQNLKEELLQAEVIVAAIGIPKFVTADMVSEGAIIFDVGINRISDATEASGSRLVGDVDFEHVVSKASLITPVPGGIGLMTIIGLLKNTVLSYKNKFNG